MKLSSTNDNINHNVQYSISWSYKINIKQWARLTSSINTIYSRSRVLLRFSNLTKFFSLVSLSSFLFRFLIFVWNSQENIVLLFSLLTFRDWFLCMNSSTNICVQIQQFLKIDHKFDNLVSQNIKNFLKEYIKDSFLSSNVIIKANLFYPISRYEYPILLYPRLVVGYLDKYWVNQCVRIAQSFNQSIVIM